MEQSKAEQLCDELQQLISPAPRPDSDAQRRVESILAKFDPEGAGIGIKAREIGSWFQIWFSTRKWQQYGSDGGHIRGTLISGVNGIRSLARRVNKTAGDTSA